MSDSIEMDGLEAVLGELSELEPGDHPEEWQLLDYHLGCLASRAEAEVRSHLVKCPDCARQLLELAPFADAAAGAGVSDITVGRAWRDFRKTLRAEEGRGARRGWTLRPAVAAGLVAALVGLSSWVGFLINGQRVLRMTIAELSQPQVNPPVVHFEETTRAASDRTLELAPDQPFVLVVILVGPLDLHPRYDVELTDASGSPIWRDSGLEPDDDSTLRIRLPSHLLENGELRARVLGVEDGRRTEVLAGSVKIERR